MLKRTYLCTNFRCISDGNTVPASTKIDLNDKAQLCLKICLRAFIRYYAYSSYLYLLNNLNKSTVENWV